MAIGLVRKYSAKLYKKRWVAIEKNREQRTKSAAASSKAKKRPAPDTLGQSRRSSTPAKNLLSLNIPTYTARIRHPSWKRLCVTQEMSQADLYEQKKCTIL
ncbi:hypothetical protein J4E83_005350 [Alternaria metachromatica]|uniref:uncharacterized protein n=1 Tax=Alternaria metachromatica TaxID=283354 RepID=UPI0020C215BE|nr:uncharacterized protein J4E83_005350 [Alternaria metachromatica]KAI4620987.1 hypothetical protein J4E83_005350 [Alternaria metachromatica]